MPAAASEPTAIASASAEPWPIRRATQNARTAAVEVLPGAGAAPRYQTSCTENAGDRVQRRYDQRAGDYGLCHARVDFEPIATM